MRIAIDRKDGPFAGRLSTYRDFRYCASVLAEIVNELTDIHSELGLSEASHENLTRLQNVIQNETFRIIVVGGFSRGKSTMINALIGSRVLPAKLAPTTATITTIRYGDPPRATVIYKGHSPRSEDIPVSELRSVLVIKQDGLAQDAFGSRIDTEVQSVILWYPLELCRDGVEIIDTPGLEEDETRQRITMSYLSQADAAIMVLSCQQLLTTEELRFIKEELQSRGFNHLFYVVNFCDQLSTPEDHEDICARVTDKLGSDQRVFLVSSSLALAGKENNDPEAVKQSNFPALERSLEIFLVSERGRHKLQTAQNLIEGVLSEIRSMIGLRRKLLESRTEEEIANLSEEFNTQRAAIMQKKERAIARIGERGALIGERISSSFMRKCRDLSLQLPEMARRIEVEGHTVTNIIMRGQYQEQTAAKLNQYVLEEMEKWCKQEAGEFITEEFERLQAAASEDLKDILENIDSIRFMIDPDLKPQMADGTINTFERVLAAAGGLFFGDIGAAVTGGVLGIKGTVMQIGSSFAASYLLFMLGLLNPVTAMAVSLGTAAMVITSQGSKALEDLRVRIAQEIGTRLQELPDEQDVAIRTQVHTHIDMLARAVDAGVDALLANIESQFSCARNELAAARDTALSTIHEVDSKVDEITDKLHEMATSWEGIS